MKGDVPEPQDQAEMADRVNRAQMTKWSFSENCLELTFANFLKAICKQLGFDSRDKVGEGFTSFPEHFSDKK